MSEGPQPPREHSGRENLELAQQAVALAYRYGHDTLGEAIRPGIPDLVDPAEPRVFHVRLLYVNPRGSRVVGSVGAVRVDLAAGEVTPLDEPSEMARRARELDQLTALLHSGGRPKVTIALLVVNALVLGAMELLGGSTDLRVLVASGALVPSLVYEGEWWRLVTPIFIHIGIVHFIFNSWALYAFGEEVEHLYGPALFLVIYLVTGIAGNVASLLFLPNVTAGASGAIAGLLGVIFATVYRHRDRIPPAIWRPLFTNYLYVVGANVLFSLAVPRINFVAHAGGFVAGLALAYLLPLRSSTRARLE
ncbi:MAG: rhomboid family intramembrane serine protease [Chloroflexi bacterium]|nr:rhomboid family intramembrane serine protease [Chloroflexota bacterium]